MKKNDGIQSSLLIFFVYCVGIYLVPLGMMQGDLSLIPGDLADARCHNYLLEHGYKWITGQVSSFWDAPFLYPAVRVMSFSGNFLGTMPVYAFFRLLHFDRETSYQLWFFVIFTLNYFCCAWALRKMYINAVGAAAGAYLFAFSLPVIAQIGHSQLLPRFMIPLAFYFAWQYLEKREIKMFALACFAVVFQFYCEIYMGFFLILGLIALLATFILTQNNRSALQEIFRGSYRAVALRIIIIGVSILLLLPLIIPYYRTSMEYGMRSWSEISTMLPRMNSYFYPAKGSLLWNWLDTMGRSLPMSHEHRIFIGAIPILAFVLMPLFYAYHRSEPLIKKGMVAFLTIALLILLTLYVNDGFSLYKYLTLPGLGAMRAITRIILLMLFPFAVILGILFHLISENKKLQSYPFVKITLSLLILLFIILDQNVSSAGYDVYSKLDSQNRLKPIEKLVRQGGSQIKVFAYMPDKSSEPPYVVHIDAMLAAQDLNLATVNGYSANTPMHYNDYYDHYDQCDSILKLKAMAINKYGKYYKDKEIFKHLYIAGRDGCREGGESYTFMDAALPDDGYKAKITFVRPSITVSKDKKFKLAVQVKNNSARAWRCLSSDQKGKYKIHASYRWLSSDHSPLGDFDNRMSLPHDLPSGASTSLEFTIHSPPVPGKYFLEFDLVQELVSWFHDKGSPTAIIEVLVL